MIPTPAELLLSLSHSSELAILSKATLVLLIGLAAQRAARRTRASIRHLLLMAALAAAVAIPIVVGSGAAFTVSVPVRQPSEDVARPAAAAGVSPAASAQPATAQPATTPVRRWPDVPWRAVIWTVWIAGLLLSMLPAVRALWRLRVLRRTGLPWTELQAAVAGLARDRGVDRPLEVLRHEDARAPLTFGTRRPVIALPVDAVSWDEADLRRALVHELEHVKRGDWAVQTAARAICACYWFHPLVWVTWRRLSLEAERACDDAVVLSEEGTAYAEQLVSLAARLSASRAQPTLGMANRSDLAARVTAVLDATQRRGGAGIAAAATALGVTTAVVLTLAPMRAVAVNAAEGDQTSRTRQPRVESPARQPRTGSAPRRPRTGTAASRALGLALVEAIGRGDIEEVTELLGSGADVNAAVPGDGSPLIEAATHGDLRIVRLLLDRGADVNQPVDGDGSPLIAAAARGDTRVIDLLLARGADVNLGVEGDGSPLIAAVQRGDETVIRRLLDRGADVNLGVDGDGSPLIAAVQLGNMQVIRLLLEQPVNVNLVVEGDGSPLIAAAERGDMRLIDLLLERGASVNLPVEGDGNPLIAAAGAGHDAVVTRLLDRGARVDDVVFGTEHALLEASENGHLSTVRLLVARGANVNVRVWVPGFRFTRRGVSVNQEPEWRSPLSMARKRGHADVARYLRSVGARE